jgi:AraC-like DNA-binding protein
MRRTTVDDKPPDHPDRPADPEGPAGAGRGALDEADVECRTVLYPRQRLSLLAPFRRRDSHPHLTPRQVFGVIGPITIGDARLGRDVRLDCGELPGYHINLPLTGRLASRHRGEHLTAGPGRATVYRPGGETVLTHWPADCRLLCVKIDRYAVDDALENLTGRRPPASAAVAFATTMDTSAGPGLAWARLVRSVSRQLTAGHALLGEPLVAAPLAETLVRGFLLSTDHPLRATLAGGSPDTARPAAVRSALDIIEASPERPLTVALLAQECRVSVRTLQEGFRRHVGMPPMAYLREVRLRRAREELRAAGPYERTVTSVAYAWGFTHPGRFAAAYEGRFGELPAQTLRSPGGTRPGAVSG